MNKFIITFLVLLMVTPTSFARGGGGGGGHGGGGGRAGGVARAAPSPARNIAPRNVTPAATPSPTHWFWWGSNNSPKTKNGECDEQKDKNCVKKK